MARHQVTKSIIVILIFQFALQAYSQNCYPPLGPVFIDQVIPEIYIELEEDSLAAIYADPNSFHEYPAKFRFDNGSFNYEMDQVGFRLRGNTSRQSPKKSFKISFNTFVPNRDFFGLEKLNINGEHNDPSVVRAKLCWDICSLLGIPASRANHVNLFVNGTYYGVYINVEHVDEEFVESRFGSKTGNLYKCLWPAKLNYLGENPDLYKFETNGHRAYELKTNTSQDDYSDLANFIRVLNLTDKDRLAEELEEVMNMETMIRAMVMDIFTANWDGPLFNQNNFYLYQNPKTGLFEYIPFDLDNTFGIDWFNINWADRNVYDWAPSWDHRPLYTKIMSVPQFRERFTQVFRVFLLQQVQNGLLQRRALEFRDRLDEYIEDDPFYSLNYGWNLDDFWDSYNSALPTAHVTAGLIPFMYQRSSSALQQLDQSTNIESYLDTSYPVLYPNPAFTQFSFTSVMFEQVEIYESTGRKVATWDHVSENLVFDINQLKPGFYMVLTRSDSAGFRSYPLIIR